MEDLEKQEVTWIIVKLCVFFVLGLVGGILFVNISYRHRSSEADLFGYYLIEQLKKNRKISKEYLIYLLQYRGKFWLTAIIIGMSRYARGCAVLCVVISGFFAGSLSCAILVQQGYKSMLFVLLANLPQAICYVLASLILFVVIYQREKKQIIQNKMVLQTYGITVCWSTIVYLLGILSENYINPYVIHLLTKFLQI